MSPTLKQLASEYRGRAERFLFSHHLKAFELEFNGNYYATLNHVPTALEFARLVHISRPVLIQDKPDPLLDSSCFTDDALCTAMGDHEISIAVTPDGNADSIIRHIDNKEYFAEPYCEKMTMRRFLRLLGEQEAHEVHYLQSQNGNLFCREDFLSNKPTSASEFTAVRKHVPPEISWASEALGSHPDAVNLWIGDSRSVTSVHSDPYENIYTVLRGAKHFTLFPPTESCFLEERMYPRATYTRPTASSRLVLAPSDDVVRWSSIKDPTQPHSVPGAQAINIIIEAGQTLYLPAGWWHYVRQANDSTHKCVALNWWYDMEMRGLHWVTLSFLRGTLDEKNDLTQDEDS